MVDILIEGGTVITMDPERRILEDGAVAIEGERIVEVGPTAEVRSHHRANRILDARRKIVMPGMIDLHAHAGGSLTRSIGEHLTGFGYRTLHDFIAFRGTSREWWHVEALLTALERLKFGTTSCLFMLGTAPRGDDPVIPIRHAEAYEQVGIRAGIGVGPSRPPWPQEFSIWEGDRRIDRVMTMEDCFAATDEAFQEWRSRRSALVDLWVSVSRLLNPNPLDPVYQPEQDRFIKPQAEGICRLMEKHNAGAHIHAYGNAIEFAYENNPGLLGPRTVLGHCTGITEYTDKPYTHRSIEILKETDTRVVHNPRSRRIYSYDGRCPVPEMIDSGVKVGLGTDGPGPQNNHDLFLDLKAATLVQRMHFRDAFVMPAGKVLEMATIDAAAILGKEKELGSLEAGKRADVLLVDAFKPHMLPMFMPVHRLVYYATGQDVDTAIVNGRVLMEGRKVLSVDETEVLERAQEEAERTIERVDLHHFMQHPEGFWGHSKY